MCLSKHVPLFWMLSKNQPCILKKTMKYSNFKPRLRAKQRTSYLLSTEQTADKLVLQRLWEAVKQTEIQKHATPGWQLFVSVISLRGVLMLIHTYCSYVTTCACLPLLHNTYRLLWRTVTLEGNFTFVPLTFRWYYTTDTLLNCRTTPLIKVKALLCSPADTTAVSN
jgi:hypothetical protein